MNAEGKIGLRLSWDGSHITGTSITPRTLPAIGALLRGKQPSQALQIIPAIFSLCGKAQAAAAAAALDAAQSGGVADVPPWRERLVLMEALQELLWRFLLDLPRLAGIPPDVQSLASLRRRFAALAAPGIEEADWRRQLCEIASEAGAALLGSGMAALREAPDEQALLAVLDKAHTVTGTSLLRCHQLSIPAVSCTATLMPPVHPEHLHAVLLPALAHDPDFALLPHWNGQCMETGSLARMQDHPLIRTLLRDAGPSPFVRLIARLHEIPQLFADLLAEAPRGQRWVQGFSSARGVGVGWVQNARGLLLHHVALDAQGAISAYRIVAPTEWNFHPAGPCAKGLTGCAAASQDQARSRAEWLVQALDPCVSHQIEVDHA